ncbi:MAG: hypothetical protein HKN56_08485 [Gammaproteobacteria bacterium]|nr:hypothetical protein [Gammaproteobacteria bacterium]
MTRSIKIAALSAVAMLSFSTVSQAAIVELATNGGFETGDFSGWTQFPGSAGPAGQTIVSTNPSSGNFAARLTETAPAANIIKQANLAPGLWTAGQEITISFDYRGTAAAGGVLFAELFSEIDGGGTSSSVILGGGPLFPNADPNVWQTATFTGFAGPDTSGGITLQLNASCAPIAGCNADYFIDNVSITADIVPIPAAVWLFGSALGLMGWTRRRKAS